ncbi:uncharacterized protein EDB93DRAFT_1243398 [Suillus bovinus]|uniref:uncharacterized protein n=1 Tax=Suillus bovinus TaxID=48563 RepID=UPI001B85E733|nr:uncharacterized protein EDB93DRAFT_1243398 [Suillus bovinus]KAG2129647.1 hypothetical protein EDB93DRAFT_1243398 [Suillus bovinus]
MTETEEQNFDVEQTTVITWPPTPVADTTGVPSFLRTSLSPSQPAAMNQTQDATSISLHKILSLTSLYSERTARGRQGSVLLAILEVEGPDTVRVRKSSDAGRDVLVHKIILGNEGGSGDVADAWGALGVKRGDIIHLENLTLTCEPGRSIILTASPYNKPTAEICFRTMPYTRENNPAGPPARESDTFVKKVSALAHDQAR